MGDYEKRIEDESLGGKYYDNSDMVCKDCIFRYDTSMYISNSSRCEIFTELKPLEVIFENAECSEYIKE